MMEPTAKEIAEKILHKVAAKAFLKMPDDFKELYPGVIKGAAEFLESKE